MRANCDKRRRAAGEQMGGQCSEMPVGTKIEQEQKRASHLAD